MVKNNYWISPDEDKWKAQKEEGKRASGIFDTQKEAEDFARKIMEKPGNGGELITQDQHGEIRSKDTINSYDPNPPKDTEN